MIITRIRNWPETHTHTHVFYVIQDTHAVNDVYCFFFLNSIPSLHRNHGRRWTCIS